MVSGPAASEPHAAPSKPSRTAAAERAARERTLAFRWTIVPSWRGMPSCRLSCWVSLRCSMLNLFFVSVVADAAAFSFKRPTLSPVTTSVLRIFCTRANNTTLCLDRPTTWRKRVALVTESAAPSPIRNAEIAVSAAFRRDREIPLTATSASRIVAAESGSFKRSIVARVQGRTRRFCSAQPAPPGALAAC